jgi:hypothetical protein
MASPVVPIGVESGIAPVLVGENGQRVQTFFAAGGGGGGAAPLIFPTIAAMAAFNVDTPATLVQGQQAFVQSNGSTWTLKKGDATSPDGITIVTGTGGEVVKWVRENVGGYQPEALLQSLWIIDRQNVTGLASDENDGKTLATPLLHKAEVYRRWGYTWTPELFQSTAIDYLSPDTDGNDPGLFAPIMMNGTFFIQEPNSLPAPTFTGTLLAVTAKNRAGNAALRSTFTTTTGAVAVNMLLQNATRGNSVCFAQRNTGGGLWQLSQPFTPYAGTGGSPANTEVDTWANGDAIQGFALLNIDLPRVGGQAAELQAGFAGPNHIIFHLNLFDPSPGNFSPCVVDFRAMPLFVESSVARAFVMAGDVVASTASISNCALTGGSRINAQCFVNGGILSGPVVAIQGGFVDLDCIIGTGTGTQFLNAAFSTPGVFFEATLQCDGDTFFGGVCIMYGSGAVNARSGTARYTGAAVTQFPCSGGLQLNGVATGYSSSGPASPKVISNLALTAAALDAAAGVAGFGGYAWGGGASFSENGVQT